MDSFINYLRFFFLKNHSAIRFQLRPEIPSVISSQVLSLNSTRITFQKLPQISSIILPWIPWKNPWILQQILSKIPYVLRTHMELKKIHRFHMKLHQSFLKRRFHAFFWKSSRDFSRNSFSDTLKQFSRGPIRKSCRYFSRNFTRNSFKKSVQIIFTNAFSRSSPNFFSEYIRCFVLRFFVDFSRSLGLKISISLLKVIIIISLWNS